MSWRAPAFLGRSADVQEDNLDQTEPAFPL